MDINIHLDSEEAEQLSPRVRQALEELAAALCETEPGSPDAGMGHDANEDVTGFRFQTGPGGSGPISKGPLGPGPIVAGPPITSFCVGRDDDGCSVFVWQGEELPDSCSIVWA